MITIDNINKSFKKHHVLKNISFTIKEEEIFCLLGASGSGKTTLLRIMLGSIKPDTGSVILNALKVPNPKLYPIIGFMPQNDALYDELSIWDNLKFFAGLYKIKSSAFKELAEPLLKVIELFDFKDTLVSQASGGMKKRLSLAISLIHNPKYLILDEPTVGIDPVLRRKIWNYLVELKNAGSTIVVTTHVMDDVTECDSACILKEGEILAIDTVSNLISAAPTGKIEELFFMDKFENFRKGDFK